MPFLVAEILNFQGSAHHVGVGSLSYNWKSWPFNVSLAGRQLSHRVAAEYGTGGRLGWQSAQV